MASGGECKDNDEQVTPCNWGSHLAGGTCSVFLALHLMIDLSNSNHPKLVICNFLNQVYAAVKITELLKLLWKQFCAPLEYDKSRKNMILFHLLLMVGLKSEIADLNNCCASNLTKNALKVLSCLCCGVHVCKYFSHFQNEILLLPFNHFLPSYLCSPLWTFSLVSCFKKEKSK